MIGVPYLGIVWLLWEFLNSDSWVRAMDYGGTPLRDMLLGVTLDLPQASMDGHIGV